MKDITVLLSASGSPTMPGFINCLRNNGERNIRIIGIDMSEEPTCRLMVDKFYKVPAATDSNYCEMVLEICKKEGVDIYFPNISAEVSVLSDYMKQFQAIGTLVSMSNRESVAISNDKLRTYSVLKEAGISVPDFYEVDTVEDFIEGCKALGYPKQAVCLKIVRGSGSRGVRIIDNSRSRYDIFAYSKPNTFFISYEEMLSTLKSAKKLDHMMLMPYLPGNEYTVDLLAEEGKVLYLVGRDNVDSLMSIAQESVIIKDELAYQIAEGVAKLLCYSGNMGIDFMKDSNGTPVLTDINPRITATVSLAAAGGINFPYLRVKQLLGEKLPKCEVNYGVRMKRRYYELFCDKDGNSV